MRRLWPDSVVEEGNLFQNLHVLRKALGTAHDGSPFIETLRRRGFRFSAEVSDNTDSNQSSPRPIVIERSDNVYSVASWQKGRPAIADSPVRRFRLGYALIAVLALVAVGGIAASSLLSGRAASSDSIASRPEIIMTALTNGRDVNDATISPDGTQLAYHEMNGETFRLMVQQTDKPDLIELIAPTTTAIGPKTFSRDGRTIHFEAIEPGSSSIAIYSIALDGGSPIKVVDGISEFHTIGVSPDGRLTFIRRSDGGDHSISIVDADGRNETTVYRAQNGMAIWGGLSWSEDGRSIAYGLIDQSAANRPRCTISAVDAETGAVRDLSAEKWDGCGRMAWTNDGKGLFFIGTRENESLSSRRDQLFYLSAETGEARRITTDGNRHQVSSLGVTRKNDVLVVPFNRSSQLWTVDPSGNAATARQITTGTADGRPGIAPLPDDQIAFVARTGENLNVWTIAGDGTGLRQITSDPPAVEELRASADGRSIYFSATTSEGPRLFRCDPNGSNMRVAVSDPSFDIDSSISPDGLSIVYNSAVHENKAVKRTLRMTSPDGGEPIQLTDSFGQAPHFSPDGRYVSYVGEKGQLRVVSFPDGLPVATLQTVGNPFLNPGARWTPDGTSLLYIVRRNGAANIWRKPLSGSPAIPLTNFTSGEIYNFVYSFDASKLILARGYPTKNAVLISLPN